eukprot:TRINITY_DN38364_c0_g1_i1.p1 TRINITY_DN38364_c0_g1~~TRINITY_DN38364_c0_g1_i1.p1  ORF type:complete len:265 (+),score=49.56 TRINITY_DN38364_c0_g1_i1:30-797(+)
MTTKPRSKYAGFPGSITAIHVGRSANAFEPIDPESAQGIRREEVLAWKEDHKLGEKKKWDSSTSHPWRKFPDRALKRELVAFQALKMQHNFRAQQLPTCYKKNIFFPKRNKFQPDPSLLLSSNEKDCIVNKNVGGELSRTDFCDTLEPSFAQEKQWNTSTSLEKEKSNIFHAPSRPKVDYGTINKLRVTPKNYRSPEKTVVKANRAQSQLKERLREEERIKQASINPKSFTLSNRDEWINLPPLNSTVPKSAPTS